MENKKTTEILERLSNIESSIYLIFDELQRRTSDESLSFAMYASTYMTAQQVNEIHKLFGQATCELMNGSFDITKFRKEFESFRKRHLPRLADCSLRVIAEGYIAEERTVDLCTKILKNIEEYPEKSISKFIG